MAERSESFISDAHGRDHVTHAEMAFDKDGKALGLQGRNARQHGRLPVDVRALRADLAARHAARRPVHDAGGLLQRQGGVHQHRAGRCLSRRRPSGGDLPARAHDVEGGARTRRRPGRDCGGSNFIQPSQFPYQTPVAVVYDTGDYEASLDKALELADYKGFDGRAAAAKARPASCAASASRATSRPAASRRRASSGHSAHAPASTRRRPSASIRPASVTVLTGSHSHGQGHETTFAQVVADKLGIPIEQIDIVHGDTAKVPFGMGTYGSRSLAVGGTAIVNALNKVDRQGREDRSASARGVPKPTSCSRTAPIQVKGTDKKKTFGEIALTAYVPHKYPIETIEPGLEETAFYDPKNFTYPGRHLHLRGRDRSGDRRDRGSSQFIAADDFGNIVNPMIVEGQVHGGLVQGIGQALLENAVYDENGQLKTGSYMDYCMPRADDVPSFKVTTTVTPCTHNPLGVKGCGEAGAIGSPPAVINAICDALRDVRRRPHRHAGDAREGVAGDQCGAAPRPPNNGPGRKTHVLVRLSARPASVADAVRRSPPPVRKPCYLAGGQTLLPTLKQRLAHPSRAHRSRRRRASSRASAATATPSSSAR